MKNADARAFTLIEVLTVISILMIIAGFMVRGGSPARDTFLLEQTANQIADLYREARQNSISAIEFNGIYPSYGVSIGPPDTNGNPERLLMYARDVAPNADLSISNNICFEDDSQIVQDINFPGDINLESINIIRKLQSGDGAPIPIDLGWTADLVFVRPLSTVVMARANRNCGGPNTYGTSELQIVLVNTQGNRRQVTVSTTGNVEVSIP